jgi:hypothetical protein
MIRTLRAGRHLTERSKNDPASAATDRGLGPTPSTEGGPVMARSNDSVARRQFPIAAVRLADLRVTAKDPVTGRRIGLWTGDELFAHVTAAGYVFRKLHQLQRVLRTDDERGFLLEEFLTDCMLKLAEAGGAGDNSVAGEFAAQAGMRVECEQLSPEPAVA